MFTLSVRSSQAPVTPGHLRLTAQLALGADLLGHASHFAGEGVQLVHHDVDGVLQLQDLALHVHGDLLGQVALRHRGGDFGDVADLTGQVGRHEVHVVGQILPGAGHALHLGLAAQLALGADLARHPGDFAGEGVQLVHHDVDGVLQLQNLALHVHGDLAAQVAVGHRRGHFGDVAHLTRQVVGHGVDVVGEVLPRAGHALHVRLTAQLAFRADLARHARHFGREGAQLPHHGVHDASDAQELAAQRPLVVVQFHRLGQVALGHGADHARHLGGRMHHVGDQVVHRLDAVGPGARGARQLRPGVDPALASHGLGQTSELAAHPVVHLDDLVERVRQFAVHPAQVHGQAHREVPPAEGPEGGEKLSVVERIVGDRSHGHCQHPYEISVGVTSHASRRNGPLVGLS
jgi:hypothetical protein